MRRNESCYLLIMFVPNAASSVAEAEEGRAAPGHRGSPPHAAAGAHFPGLWPKLKPCTSPPHPCAALFCLFPSFFYCRVGDFCSALKHFLKLNCFRFSRPPSPAFSHFFSLSLHKLFVFLVGRRTCSLACLLARSLVSLLARLLTRSLVSLLACFLACSCGCTRRCRS